MAEPPQDVARPDRPQGIPHRLNQPVDRPGGGRPQVRLELAEEPLDRVEVRAVRRQVADLGPGRGDQPRHLGRLVARQVVHHHDVPRPQRRGQAPLDIGLEGRRVGRPVERQAGRLRDAAEADRRGQGDDLPVAVRHRAVDPHPAGGPAVGAVHRRRAPDSSTKTNRAGSTAANSSRQAARSAFNSGRSCSAARRDFFFA